MLRTIRLTTAFICFTLVTLLFLDFTGTLHTWFGWLAKIQFLPAVLALNLGVVLLLIAFSRMSFHGWRGNGRKIVSGIPPPCPG